MHLHIKNNSETTYTLFTLAKKSKLLNNDKIVVKLNHWIGQALLDQ